MKKFRVILLMIAAVLFVLPASFAQKNADDILGVWMNEDQDAHIEITKRDNEYFGKLIWLKNPTDEETGKPKLDKHNPDESLRSRATWGLEILTNFVFDGDNRWEDGKIYDPKKGKTYSCYMKFDDEKTIKIRGFIGVTLLGRTTYWTHVE